MGVPCSPAQVKRRRDIERKKKREADLKAKKKQQAKEKIEQAAEARKKLLMSPEWNDMTFDCKYVVDAGHIRVAALSPRTWKPSPQLAREGCCYVDLSAAVNVLPKLWPRGTDTSELSHSNNQVQMVS